MQQKGFAPFLVLLITGILLAIITLLYTQVQPNFSQLLQQITGQEQPKISQSSDIAVFFEEGGNIFTANADGSEVGQVLQGQTLISVSPDGSSYLSKNDEGRYFLNTNKDKSVEINKLSVSGIWSNDSRSVVVFIRSIVNYGDPQPTSKQMFELWDIKSLTKLRTIEIDRNYSIVALYNNNDLLLQKVREDRTEANVDISQYDSSTKKINFIDSLKVSSMPIKLSPDETGLAYSDGDNLIIYNFNTRESERNTKFSEEPNDETVWNVYWSPNGKLIAFQTFGNTKLGDRIGILNLQTDTIKFFDETMVEKLIQHPPGTSGRISSFDPISWDASSKNIYAKSEIILVDEKDETGITSARRADRYWLISIENDQFTELSRFNNTKRIYVVNN